MQHITSHVDSEPASDAKPANVVVVVDVLSDVECNEATEARHVPLKGGV